MIYGYGVGVYAAWTRSFLVEREYSMIRPGLSWLFRTQLPGLFRSAFRHTSPGVRARLSAMCRAEADRFVELLGALPIVVEEVPLRIAAAGLLSRAREHGLSAYDAAYLDLAVRKGLPLATRDSALRSACEKVGVSLLR